MAPIPADLQQNIIITLYLTVLHNFVAIGYFLGLIVSTIFAFHRPSRPLILAMAGFALLLFAFEYNKHLAEEFKNQTLNSVITERTHFKAQMIINLFFNKLIPYGVPVAGWLCLAGALFLVFKNRVQLKKSS